MNDRSIDNLSQEDGYIVKQITPLATVAIERTPSEDQLRRSESLLECIQRLSLSGTFAWSAASATMTLSDEVCRIFEIAPGSVLTGQIMRNLIHPKDLHLLREKLSGSETEFRFECRLCFPSGAIKYLEVCAEAIRDDVGRLTELIGAVMDVSQKKCSLDAISATKATFEGILEIAEDAIISVDASQRIAMFNQSAEKTFGYYLPEVLGQPLELLLPQYLAHDHSAQLEQFSGSSTVDRGAGTRREVVGLRKDGSGFAAEVSISRTDHHGEPVFTIILRDITERKQAAEALLASERFARGQMEALTRTLDALARESVPDRVVEHVLSTITEQLGAHSCSLWRRDEQTGLVGFEFGYENAALFTKDEAGMVAVQQALRIEDVWPWPEVFSSARPYLLSDIREATEFPWREHVLSLGVISILIVPMTIAGRVEGVIGIRFATKRKCRTEEMELAQALANQAMLALQLTRLSAQGRRAAVMAERNRMARDIHDTLAQGFTGVIVQLDAATDARAMGLEKAAEEHLMRARDLARESLQEARRSVRALRPLALEDQGLSEALRGLIRKMTTHTRLRTEFVVQGEPRTLNPEWEENLLRIAQEIVTNALRHSRANHLSMHLIFDNGTIHLRAHDNGAGFDLGRQNDGFGLIGMGERVECMGGTISIQSASGAGTAILIELPNQARPCLNASERR
ncbi:PAS domain S-box protein [Silvimonas sp.]|uniref:sensor histidine kinase n=1 Tax=Silvimonas sp. TaxID=2650811 RepID=UPI002843864F|nr:PAS domain S-box protein [Silvimonas sp.]MDR3428770.1 PAS domain S-box protein [Silvimonas sp.]